MDLKRYGPHRRSIRGTRFMELEFGKAYTLNLVSQDEMLAYVDSTSMRDEGQVLLLSRLPQRRLLEHVDLDKVEAHWVTTQDVKGSIQPSLEQISDLVTSRIENHTGIVVIEGIEWLISLHGFEPVLNFVMKLKDSLHQKPWALLLVVAEGIMDTVQYTQWLREAMAWIIPKKVEVSEITLIEEELLPDELETEKPLSDGGGTPLSFLVRIPREGYSKEIVRRRILQWRRMGLDVSAAEPALFQDSDDLGFEIYNSVEQKVRRAVELDNRLDILLELGHKSEVTKMRFRVRQLTGFADVESRINQLI
jgi:hypothetical protein